MNQAEIKELLKRGYSPEIISFEFGVPIDSIRNEKIESTNVGLMEKIRRRYHSLYYGSNIKDENFGEKYEQSAGERKEVEEKIEEMKELSIGLPDMSKDERYRVLKDIISIAKSISKYNSKSYHLTATQAKEIKEILDNPLLDNLSKSRKDRVDLVLRKIRKGINLEYADAIANELIGLYDIDELKKYEKMITLRMEEEHIRFSTIRAIIRDRISKINQSRVLFNVRNSVSKNVETAISQIIGSDFDKEQTRGLIVQEATERVNNSPKNTFSLSQKQQERQVEMQIKILLAENADKYKIADPNQAVKNLEGVMPNEKKLTIIRVVTDNLVGQNEYEKALEFCDEYIVRGRYEEEPQISREVRRLRKRVVFSQIGYMLLERINSDPRDDDETFIKTFIKQLKQRGTSFGTIPLGKSRDGNCNITFANVVNDIPEKIK